MGGGGLKTETLTNWDQKSSRGKKKLQKENNQITSGNTKQIQKKTCMLVTLCKHCTLKNCNLKKKTKECLIVQYSQRFRTLLVVSKKKKTTLVTLY